MTLLATGALWLLGLGAVVAGLYFLKRQAQSRTVSSLLFWQGVERRPRSALRFARMPLWGLLLQLLALIAIVLALAQPVVRTSAGGAETLAIVLDGSASMRAQLGPDGPPRATRAVDHARDVLDRHSAAEVALIRAQTHSTISVPATREHGRVRDALDAFAPSYQGDADPSALLSLLDGAFPEGADRTVFIGDRPVGPSMATLGWTTRYVASASPGANAAVTRFEVRPQPDGQGMALLARVWNGAGTEREVPFRVRSGETVLAERALRVPAQGTATVDLTLDGAARRAYTAEIDTAGLRDDWSEDDRRYATPPRREPWQISWIGEDNFYLRRFFERAGRARVDRRPKETVSSLNPNTDAILLHKTSLTRTQPGSYLLVDATMPPWVSSSEGEETGAAGPDRVSVRRDHRVLDGLNPEDWRLNSAPAVEIDAPGEVLVTLGGRPLLALLERGGVRVAYLGVDLDRSNLALTVDFPILLQHLLAWLAPQPARSSSLVIGDHLPLAPFGTDAAVTTPDGQTCSPEADPEDCGLVQQPGFYRVAQGPTTQWFAANPPAEESRQLGRPPEATPSSPSASGSTDAGAPSSEASEEASNASIPTQRPLWPYVLGVGLALLAMELLLFDPPSMRRAEARRTEATDSFGEAS